MPFWQYITILVKTYNISYMVYVLHVVKIEEGQQHTPGHCETRLQTLVLMCLLVTRCLQQKSPGLPVVLTGWTGLYLRHVCVYVCMCPTQHFALCWVRVLQSSWGSDEEPFTKPHPLPPSWWRCFFLGRSPFPPLLLIHSPPLLRVISQTLLKWLPAIRPKSQLHVIWCCQL